MPDTKLQDMGASVLAKIMLSVLAVESHVLYLIA